MATHKKGHKGHKGHKKPHAGSKGGVHHSSTGRAYRKHPKTGKWVRVKAYDRHPPRK